MFNHASDERFLFVMAALGEAAGQESSAFKEKVYAEALKDVHIEQIESAAWEIIRNRTLSTFPKVGELREYIHGGKSEDKAVIALNKLERAMSSVGKYRSVTFEDQLITATVSAMGGWPKLCCMDQDEWKWARKDFDKIYRAFAVQPLNNLQIPEHLPGIEERDNSANGFIEPPKVVMIGTKGNQLLLTATNSKKQ